MFSPLPPTILFFDHTAKMGGGEISLLNLVTHIDRRQFEPVVVLSEAGPLSEKLRDAGVETHVLPLSTDVTGVRKDALTGPRAVSIRQVGEILCYVWRLRKFARARGAKIIHTNSLKADILGAFAGRLSGMPVIWHVRDRIADDYLPSAATRIFRMLCRFLPNYVVVNSLATLEALQLPASQRARTVYNGIVHDGLPQVNEAEIQAMHEITKNDEVTNFTQPCIGLVGRISPWKGQDVFLRATAVVREKYPHARFQIIGAPLFGEEKYEAKLHDLSAQLGLQNNVEWLGFRSDVPALLTELTMLVHASKTGEPFGQVVVEAMMAGLPVIATDGGGVPEIVVREQTGLLVPMNDADSMATAMLRLLDDPAFADRLGRAGRVRALEKFTIGHTVAKISRLYNDVLADHHERRQKRKRWALTLVLFLLVVAIYKVGKNRRPASH